MAQPRRRDPNQGSNNGNQARRSSSSKSGGGGGMFFLFIFAMIACGAAAFVLFPDEVMRLLGQKPAQTQDPQPIVEKPIVDDSKTTETTKKPVIVEPTVEKPVVKEPTVKEPVVEAPSYKQDVDAQAALQEAREAYASFEWTDARSKAGKVLRMDISPETKLKTEQLIKASKELQDFMKNMTSDQYGMTRGIYTTGAVAQITYPTGKTEDVIPIADMNSTTPATKEDPVAFIQAKLNAGEAYVLNEKGIPALVKPNQIISVDPADLEGAKARHYAEAKEKFTKVKNNPLLANDAIALYDVARYSYQMGVDKPVTVLLERALTIDPDLATSVRNDRANESYQKMVRSMQKQSMNTAAGHLRYLQKHYEDTYVYKEAQAYYKGENEQLAQMQKEERDRISKTKKEAREAAKASAIARKDEAAIKQIEEIETIEVETQIENQKYADGDEGTAKALWDKGREYLAAGLADGADDKAGTKDKMLGLAFKELMKAKALYIKLAEAGSKDATNKLVELNQDAYEAKKSMRP